jgi:hypothetical protein
MSIIGYSERGILNSIAYFLDANSQHIYNFIKTLEIPLPNNDNDYRIFIEQSFSDFGDSDLIIIITNKNSKKKTVIFIECKIKTSQGAFRISSELKRLYKALSKSEKIRGISSNLFVQLYYKHLLIKTNGDSSNDNSVNKIFKKSNGTPRVLGGNTIIGKAFNEIKNADRYYYAAIIPTDPNEMNIKLFREKMRLLNEYLRMDDSIYLSYWGDIENYFKNINATKVLEVFNYNEGQIY